MKTLNYNLVVLLCMLLAAQVFAGSPGEYEKLVSEEFAIAADGEVEIDNKYGPVEVIAWDSDKVRIDVTITVDANSKDKAEEVFDRVNIAFTNSTSYVRAVTEINTAKGWGNWWNNNDKFEISHKIQLPASVHLDLENKYGDIYVGPKDGDADIVIKYGNLRMDGISGDLNIDMGYGKGSVTSAADVSLVMKYSSLRFGTVGDVRADTKYSGFEIDEVGDLRSSTSYDNYRIRKVGSFTNIGKYDDFVIGEAETVNVDSRYSNLEVSVLHNSADLTFKYGGVKLDAIQPGFSSVEIESEYTGVKVAVVPSASYVVDVLAQHAGVRYDNIEVYVDKKSNSDTELRGYRGSRDASSKITARLRYGSFRIN